LCSRDIGIRQGWATLSVDYVARAGDRLLEMESLSRIGPEMFRRAMLLTLVLLGALLCVLRRVDGVWRRAWVTGLLILALYCLALFFVYLGTPMDLRYHLETSVARTMMAPRAWTLVLLLAGAMVWRGTWRPVPK
jgi:hypothetical protein